MAEHGRRGRTDLHGAGRSPYDFETLARSLSLAGFRQIVRERFGCSTHEALRGIDRHDGGETGRHWIPGIVLTVEATK